MRTFYLCAFLFISVNVFSQNSEIDSLLKVVETQSDNTVKVNTLISICNNYYRVADQIKAIEYGKIALALAEKINYTYGRLDAHCSLHQAYALLGDNPEMLKNLYKCLKLAEDSGRKEFVGLSLQFLGSANYRMNNDEDALKYFFASLKVRKEMNDSGGIAQTYNSIGGVYVQTEKYSDALPYFKLALNMYEELGVRGPYWGESWSYTNLAAVHLQMGLSEADSGSKEEARKEFTEALKNAQIAFEIKKGSGFNPGIIESYQQIGEILFYLEKSSLARPYFEKGILLSKAAGYPNQLAEFYKYLSTIDSISGNYLHAYQNYKMSVFYKDSIESKRREKETVKIQMQYEFDKKEIAAKAEQEKKDAVTAAEINRQKAARNFSMAGAIGILAFGGFAFYNFRKRKKLEKQQALTDERLRISRDLHDDLGASLSSISVFSSAVKRKLLNNETQDAEELLERMSTDAQEMVSGMSEMVWTISPHNDTIEKLTDRLQVYAAGMLSAKNISFKLECDEELKSERLEVEIRKNIYLILKEAINNAGKYSGATEVMLIVSRKENRFVIVLSDNGKGFDVSSLATGNGLNNMRQRADEIQSQIEISSEINKGTAVTLRANIP